MENFEINLQLIRKSVMHSQLLALQAQAQAIYYLNTEHQNGIDLGRSPLVLITVQHVKDVADSAKSLAQEAKSISGELMFGRLKALQDLAQSCVERAEEVCRHGTVDASRRLDQSLVDNLDGGESVSQVPEVPHDAKHLQLRADIACHGAETHQFETFKLQVRAICDLALELSFSAAAEAGHSYPSDSSYWKNR